jgi:hypothetical protein
MTALQETVAEHRATEGMLEPDYWNAVTSLLFDAGFQALVSTRCSPATSCYSSSSNSITSKLYLVPCRGKA